MQRDVIHCVAHRQVTIRAHNQLRQIRGGAVRLEGEKITDPNQEFSAAAELEGKVLQLGKKTFRRLTV